MGRPPAFDRQTAIGLRLPLYPELDRTPRGGGAPRWRRAATVCVPSTVTMLIWPTHAVCAAAKASLGGVSFSGVAG